MGKVTPRKRKNLGLIALEPRWMFDGAVAVDVAHAATDPIAKALITAVPSPVEVCAADPSRDDGKKEAVFIDTSAANWQSLVTAAQASRPGAEIDLVDNSHDGLVQIATWAATHSGYDAIHILSTGAEGELHLGSGIVSEANVADAGTREELAEIGHALNSGGEILLYGSNVAVGSDGAALINDLATESGAVIAAAYHVTGDACGATWALDRVTGATRVGALSLPVYGGTLGIGDWGFVDGAPSPVEVQTVDAALNGGKYEAAFVDSSAPDWGTLVSDIRASNPGMEILVVDGSQSGLVQIARWASAHSGYDSIAIFSHGDEARAFLGSDVLTDQSLGQANVRSELAGIGSALKTDGAILLYACNVADGSDGKAFVTDLAAATGVTVAASTGVVGAAAKGGNWNLDYGTANFTAPTFDLLDYRAALDVPTQTYQNYDFGSLYVNSSQSVDGSTSMVNYLANVTYTATYNFSSSAGFSQINKSGFSPSGSDTTETFQVVFTPTAAISYSTNFTTNLYGNGVLLSTFIQPLSGSGVNPPPPSPPLLTMPVITSPGQFSSNTITITGTSSSTDAGATITVSSLAADLGSTIADSNGNWNLTVTQPYGQYIITAGATKNGCTASMESDNASLLVDPGPSFTSSNRVVISDPAAAASAGVWIQMAATDPASTLTYSKASSPSQGYASVDSPTARLFYKLNNASFTGSDTVTVKAKDSYGLETTQTITILVDTPPTVTTTNPAPPYVVGGTAQVVDSGITITDPDSPGGASGFGGGTLVAAITGNSDTANDSLSVVAQTLANGHVITLQGSTVKDSGTVIGTISGGIGASPLTITLASGVTSSQVTDLGRAVGFSGGATTSSATRTVTFTVTDGVGISATGTATVRSITGPTVASATYDPATGTLKLTGYAFTTSAGNYDLSKLTITGEHSGTYALGNGDAITGTPISTSLTIHIASANQATLDALLNRSGATSSFYGTPFAVSASADWDTSGGIHSDASSATIAVTSAGTPTVTDSNPSIPSAPTTGGVALQVYDGSIAVTDAPDLSGQGMWQGGSLRVSIGTGTRDTLHDTLSFLPGNGITLSNSMSGGSIVSYNGTAFGTIAGGATGAPGQTLIVDLNASASDAAVAALVKTIQFSDSGATSAGYRTINTVVIDAYGRASATLTDLVSVYVPPTITSAGYDPNTGLLTLNGTNFTVNPTDFALSKLTLRGEAGGTYTLGAADMISVVTPTRIVIQIDATNQVAVDTLLDKNGTSAVGGTAFNLATLAGWDVSGAITETASAINAITVTSSGTPTLVHSGTTSVSDLTANSIPVTIEGASVTAADLAAVAMWNSGNLTASVGGASDAAHDQLTVAALGGITTSGSTAGSTVSYNGTIIGTIKAGADGTPGKSLTITLNANATSAAIAALAKAIQFSDSGTTAAGGRTVNFVVTDAYGASSTPLADTVNVVQAPTIDGTGAVSGGWLPTPGQPSQASGTMISSPDGSFYSIYSSTVYKYSAGSWTSIPSTGLGSNSIYEIYASPSSAIVALASDSSNNTYAYTYNAATSSWTSVGAMIPKPYVSGSSGYYTAVAHIAMDSSGNVFVSRTTVDNNFNYMETTVLTWSGGSWVTLGSNNFTYSAEFRLYVAPNGTLYGLATGYMNNWVGQEAGLNVFKYTGSSWSKIGNFVAKYDSGSSGLAFGPDNSPYIFYTAVSANNTAVLGNGVATVAKYNGSSWVTLASPQADTSDTNNIANGLAIASDGSLYASYLGDVSVFSGANTQGIYVVKYSGGAWGVPVAVVRAASSSSYVDPYDRSSVTAVRSKSEQFQLFSYLRPIQSGFIHGKRLI